MTLKSTLVELFDSFDTNGIDYCLLRGWDDISEGNIKTDVDVLIRSTDRSAAEAVFENYGFTQTIGGSTSHTTFARYVAAERTILGIDVAWDGTAYNAVPLLDAKKVLERRRRVGEFWVPCEADYFVQLVFHSVLNKNRYKPSYRRDLIDLCPTVDQELVRSHANAMFGTTGEQVVDLALRREFAETLDWKWKLVWARLRRQPTVVWLLIWNLLIYHQLLQPARKLNKRHNPFSTVPTIVLLGPDGSGKTTVAREIVSILRDNGIEASYARLGVYNNQTQPLQLLNRLYSGGTTSSTTTNDGRQQTDQQLPAKKPTHKAVLHFIDILYRTVRAQMRSTDVLVADRYVHDLYVHDSVGPLEPLFEYFETDPFYGFVLTADPEVIGPRSEFDEKSIAEMLRRLESVGFARIDVSQDVDGVVDDVLYHVFADGEFISQLK